MSATTFHPFPDLPMEIKLQILMTACTESTFPGHLSPDQGGLHYVNIDTIRTGGGDLLTLRVLDKQDLNDDTLDELKAENSARGLVATWMEGVASGWVQTPQLYLIDKGTLFVSQTPGYSPVYHDCDGKYIRMYEEWCGDAISAFIHALDELLSLDKYGDLYKENSPDSWDEDAEEWLEFDIFSNIKVLARFEYADHKEVSWTAVCNDLYNDDVRGSEHAVTSYGRVYDLTYDDDVGYCVGEFGNPRVLSSSDDDDESGSDDDLGRVEYVKLF
ncbi:Uncharacterized protein LW94_14121 [Fusarium fujikuroi]|nr:Uncharacterized protein LW94_14121 [Fusarium fujikuroi]